MFAKVISTQKLTICSKGYNAISKGLKASHDSLPFALYDKYFYIQFIAQASPLSNRKEVVLNNSFGFSQSLRGKRYLDNYHILYVRIQKILIGEKGVMTLFLVINVFHRGSNSFLRGVCTSISKKTYSYL